MYNYMSSADRTVMGIIIIAIVLLVIFLYIVFSLILNRLNKVMYGKGTIMAWLLLTHVYLLGKLTVNKVFGWILVILNLLSAYISDGILDLIFGLGCLGLYIYADIKYKKLKKTQNEEVSLNSDSYSLPNNTESDDSAIGNDFYSTPQNTYVNNNIANTNVQNTNNDVGNNIYNNLNNNMINNTNGDVKTSEELKTPPKKVGNDVDLFTPVIQSVPKAEIPETKEESPKESPKEVKEKVDDTEIL